MVHLYRMDQYMVGQLVPTYIVHTVHLDRMDCGTVCTILYSPYSTLRQDGWWDSWYHPT